VDLFSEGLDFREQDFFMADTAPVIGGIIPAAVHDQVGLNFKDHLDDLFVVILDDLIEPGDVFRGFDHGLAEFLDEADPHEPVADGDAAGLGQEVHFAGYLFRFYCIF